MRSQPSCDTPNGASNQFIGGAAGPLVAGEIQSGMTPIDNGCVGLTLEYAQNSQPVAWQNPGNGAQYQVTPVRGYQAPNGLNCREYTIAATLNGRSQRIDDTACRLPNGLWQLQSWPDWSELSPDADDWEKTQASTLTEYPVLPHRISAARLI